MSPSVYQGAVERYAAAGVDAERALNTLATIPVSLHCWQGDDVGGFEAERRIAWRRHRRDRQLSREGANA